MLSCIWFYIVCLCVGYFTDTPFGFIMQVIACATVVLFSTALREEFSFIIHTVYPVRYSFTYNFVSHS